MDLCSKIYIIFGPEPRYDGENIKGVFANRESAEAYRAKIASWSNHFTKDYSIVEHDVEK